MMKRVLIIIMIFFLSSNLYAQLEVIPTGIIDPLGGIVRIGNTTLVQSFNNYVLRSDDDFNTSSNISLPCNPNYGNAIKEASGKLFLCSRNWSPFQTSLWMSNDTGDTWIFLYDTLGFVADDFLMFDSLHGAMIGSQYALLKTSDGGFTWSSQFSGVIGSHFMKKYNDSIGLWASMEKVHLTYNRFDSITISHNNFLLNPYYCQILSPDTILFTSASSGVYFVYTTDSAKSWHAIDTQPFRGSGLFFFNGNEGYVVGRDGGIAKGAICKTTDMGNSWVKYSTGIDCDLTDIAFLNDSIALVTGTDGVLLKWNKYSVATEIIDIENNHPGFSIYPNPVNNILHINSASNEKYTLKLYDQTGREVFAGNPGIKKDIEINTTHFASGPYYYLLFLESGKRYSGKMVKE